MSRKFLGLEPKSFRRGELRGKIDVENIEFVGRPSSLSKLEGAGGPCAGHDTHHRQKQGLVDSKKAECNVPSVEVVEAQLPDDLESTPLGKRLVCKAV